MPEAVCLFCRTMQRRGAAGKRRQPGKKGQSSAAPARRAGGVPIPQAGQPWPGAVDFRRAAPETRPSL